VYVRERLLELLDVPTTPGAQEMGAVRAPVGASTAPCVAGLIRALLRRIGVAPGVLPQAGSDSNFMISGARNFGTRPFVKGREEAGDVLDYLSGAGGSEVLLGLFARLISPFLSLLALPHGRTDVAGE
jgi:hypothetical protein